MDPKLVTPILITALVIWSIVRRVRRNFGRQPVQPVRIWLRIGLLTVIGVMFVATFGRSVELVEALVGGCACGAALGLLGLRHTRFEVTPQGRFYTPHTYIGLAVTLLFLGRFAYRFLYLSGGANGLFAPNPALAASQRSPLTLGMFGALIGYYVLYYAGVLLKTRAAALPAASPASPE